MTKKIMTVVAVALFAASINAKAQVQNVPVSKQATGKESVLTESFRQAGLTPAQAEQAGNLINGFNLKRSGVKANTTMSEADKQKMLGNLDAMEQTQLKAAMGDDKYSKWTAIRKAQTPDAKSNSVQ